MIILTSKWVGEYGLAHRLLGELETLSLALLTVTSALRPTPLHIGTR